MGSSTPPPGFGGSDPDFGGSEPDFGGSEPDVQGPSAERFSPTPAPPYRSPEFDAPPGVPGPLGVFATVRAALGLYGADAVKLWQVMALVIIPVQLLAFLLRVITVPTGSVLQNSKIYVPAGTNSPFALTSSLGSLLTALALLVSIGAAYRILLGRHLHHPADLITSFNFALERVLPLLWVSILTAVLVIIGFVILIIPGVYLAVSFAIAVPVLMAEDRRGFRALERSRELVSGKWWHVLGASIVAGIVAVVGELVIGLLVGPIVSALSPHSVVGYLAISGVLSVIVSILLSPFTAAVPVVLYVDMLLRKEDPQLARLLA